MSRHDPIQFAWNDSISSTPIEAAIEHATLIWTSITNTWTKDNGWVPSDVRGLLEQSNLSMHAELTRTLRLWIPRGPELEEHGRLVLGWSNLGSLVEGALKLFLCVHLFNYYDSGALRRRGDVVNPDSAPFELLLQFIEKHVYPADQWGWQKWLRAVQHSRNCIHAFRYKSIGTHDDLLDDIIKYTEFLKDITLHLPERPERPDWSE